MQKNEEEIRTELEEITRKLVQIKNKKYRTDWIEKNKEYKQLCYQEGILLDRKNYLLDLIKQQHE